MTDKLLLRIKNKNAKYGPFIYSITRFYRDFQKNNLHINGINDPGSMAIMYMIDSSMFKFMKGPVRVVTEGIAIGQTIMPVYDFQIELDPLTWKGKPIVSAAYEVDVKRILKYYEAIILGKQR